MSGYNGYRMSNNAVRAYDEDLVPISKITRRWLDWYDINESVSAVKDLIRKGDLTAQEWHHTGKYYTRTDFFGGDDLRDQLEQLIKSRTLNP